MGTTTTTGTDFATLMGFTRLPLPPLPPRCGVPVKRLPVSGVYVPTGTPTVAPKRRGV